MMGVLKVKQASVLTTKGGNHNIGGNGPLMFYIGIWCRGFLKGCCGKAQSEILDFKSGLVSGFVASQYLLSLPVAVTFS